MYKVYNLGTREEVWFGDDMPKPKAVVVAHEFARQNHNTWQYDWSQVRFGRSGRTAFCGNWAVHLGKPQLSLFLDDE